MNGKIVYAGGMSKKDEIARQDEFLAALGPIKEGLWKYCLHLCNGYDAAKELLAETISAAYANYPQLRVRSALKSWMFSTAFRSRLKTIERSRRTEPIEPEAFDYFRSKGQAPDVLADIANLYSALDKLPADQKEAIMLFHISGFSRVEIAEMQNTTAENVKARLSRGKKKLAVLLGADDDRNTEEHCSIIDRHEDEN